MYFTETIEYSRALMTKLASVLPAQRIKMYFDKIIKSLMDTFSASGPYTVLHRVVYVVFCVNHVE